MKFFAIRDITTGHFLPNTNHTTGVEPEPNCIPKLYKTRRGAESGLSWWLEGSTHRSYSDDGDGWSDLVTSPRQNRISDHMEIIEIDFCLGSRFQIKKKTSIFKQKVTAKGNCPICKKRWTKTKLFLWKCPEELEDDDIDYRSIIFRRTIRTWKKDMTHTNCLLNK